MKDRGESILFVQYICFLKSYEKMVSLNCLLRRFNGLGKASLFYEYYEDGSLVVPSKISKELINCIEKEFFTLPDFALCNKECYPLVILDKNVRFAIPIQRLSRSGIAKGF